MIFVLSLTAYPWSNCISDLVLLQLPSLMIVKRNASLFKGWNSLLAFRSTFLLGPSIQYTVNWMHKYDIMFPRYWTQLICGKPIHMFLTASSFKCSTVFKPQMKESLDHRIAHYVEERLDCDTQCIKFKSQQRISTLHPNPVWSHKRIHGDSLCSSSAQVLTTVSQCAACHSEEVLHSHSFAHCIGVALLETEPDVTTNYVVLLTLWNSYAHTELHFGSKASGLGLTHRSRH